MSECFSEGVRQARKAGPASASQALRVVNFDWHETTKRLKEKGCVEALWALLKPLLPAVGFSSGILTATSHAATSPSPFCDNFQDAEAAEPVKVAAAAAAATSSLPEASGDTLSSREADPAARYAASDASLAEADRAKHPLGSEESDADEQPSASEAEAASEDTKAAPSSISTSGRCVTAKTQDKECALQTPAH